MHNWLFKFANDNAGFLYFAFSDTTDSGNFYHGCILNKPSIRDSIDLAKSTSKTSNISVTIPDFNYQGSPISEELFGGVNHYINQTVSVYLNDTSTQIGSFRLIDISSDGSKISLSLTSHRPWDFISIPQDKTGSEIYIPVSYGNFTKNSATTFESPLFESELTNKTYRPIPFNKIANSKSLYVDGIDTSTDGELAVYEKGLDIFVPCENAVSATENTDGIEYGQIEPLQIRSFKQRADNYELLANTGVTVTNIGNAIDTDANSFANFNSEQVMANNTETIAYSFKVVRPSGKADSHFISIKESDEDNVLTNEAVNSSETGIDITSASNLSDYDVIKIDSEQMDIKYISGNTLTVGRGFHSSAETHDNQHPVEYDQTVTVLGIKYAIDIDTISGGLSKVSTFIQTDGNYYSVSNTSDQSTITKYINLSNATDTIKIKVNFTADDVMGFGDLTADFKLYDVSILTQRISEEPLETMYTGNDGLINSWDSSAITEIHEAHRDLLIRYAGLSTDTPENWSDLDTDKSGWNLRWWTLKEIELKKVLEKLQYEGGFIFRYKSDGSPQYIHIPDSPTADYTLSKNDISNITVKHTPFSELLTKMEISYEKHPAENKYISSSTHEDDDSPSVRDNWNIQTKENIKQIKLDALVDNIGSTDLTGSPNDGFADYYNNIFGDIKLQVSGTIVNPDYLGLEVGEILNFENMHPEKAFGESWSGKNFMITSMGRTVDKTTFEAREI